VSTTLIYRTNGFFLDDLGPSHHRRAARHQADVWQLYVLVGTGAAHTSRCMGYGSPWGIRPLSAWIPWCWRWKQVKDLRSQSGIWYMGHAGSTGCQFSRQLSLPWMFSLMSLGSPMLLRSGMLSMRCTLLSPSRGCPLFVVLSPTQKKLNMTAQQ
jgi:hypothetical protein